MLLLRVVKDKLIFKENTIMSDRLNGKLQLLLTEAVASAVYATNKSLP